MRNRIKIPTSIEIIPALYMNILITVHTFNVQMDIISKGPNRHLGGIMYIYPSIYSFYRDTSRSVLQQSPLAGGPKEDAAFVFVLET